MLTLVRKDGKKRFETASPRWVDDVVFGMNLGATLGLGFFGWLAAIRVVSGPGTFQRVGLTWDELAILYCVGFMAAFGAYGALEHKRRHPLAALLQGVLMIVPLAVAIPVNMALSYGRAPLDLPGLWPALIAAVVFLGVFKFWMWREERRAESESASRPNLRLERDFERRPSQS